MGVWEYTHALSLSLSQALAHTQTQKRVCNEWNAEKKELKIKVYEFCLRQKEKELFEIKKILTDKTLLRIDLVKF